MGTFASAPPPYATEERAACSGGRRGEGCHRRQLPRLWPHRIGSRLDEEPQVQMLQVRSTCVTTLEDDSVDRSGFDHEGIFVSDFAKKLWAWLNQVADDGALPASGFKLAFVLSQYINRGTGIAWPSQQTLASRSNLTDRSVRSLLAELEARGHLRIRSGKGRRVTSVYEPNLRN
jgi:hypothetical protein